MISEVFVPDPSYSTGSGGNNDRETEVTSHSFKNVLQNRNYCLFFMSANSKMKNTFKIIQSNYHQKLCYRPIQNYCKITDIIK